jgi:hypothetical protein
MKRITVVVLIVLFTVPVFSAVPVLGIVGVGLDIVTTKHTTTVYADGQEIVIGGSSIKGLNRSLDAYDFTGFSLDDRLSIYENASISIGFPVVRNALLGFGSGSKMQGDIGGKIFGEVADWASLASMGTGLVLYLIEAIIILPFAAAAGEPYPTGTEMQQIANAFLIGGAIGFGASRIVQAILPVTYGARYNKALRSHLGVTKEGGDSFSPLVSVAPVGDDYSLGLVLGARVSL